MKTLFLLFAVAFLVLQVQASPVAQSLQDNVEPQLNGDSKHVLATVTCFGRRGLCQRRDWRCPTGYMWSESVNNCPYRHLNKCCMF